MKAMTVRLCSVGMLILSACASLAPGGSSGVAIRYQVLGEISLGQATPGAPILAATSMAELESLISAHRPGELAPKACCWPGATMSQPSLLLAFGKPSRTECFEDSLYGIYLAGQAVVVEIDARKVGCVLHQLPPAPVLLIAIPLTELPRQMIEVRLDRQGDSEERSHFPWDWSATADLRRPLPGAPLNVSDIQAGVNAAWDDMAGRGWQLSEVAVRRWSAGDDLCGLPTTKTAGAEDPQGVVVRVYYVPNDGRNPWVAKQHEYRWRVGQASYLDDCGDVASPA